VGQTSKMLWAHLNRMTSSRSRADQPLQPALQLTIHKLRKMVDSESYFGDYLPKGNKDVGAAMA